MEERKNLEAVLRRLQGKFSKFYAKVLTEKHLTIPQFSLLILTVDEGPLTMSEIAEKLYIASPSVTNLVDRLENQKLIARTPEPGDRRATLIRVTPKGESLVREIRKMSVGRVMHIIERFSGREIGVITRFYELLSRTLDELLMGMKKGKFLWALALVLAVTNPGAAQVEGPERPKILEERISPLEGEAMTALDVARLAMLKSLNVRIAEVDRDAKKTEIMQTESRYDTQLKTVASYDWQEEQQPTIILGEKTITSLVNANITKKTPFGLEAGFFHENQRNSTGSSFQALNPSFELHAGFKLKQPLIQNAFGFIDRSEVKIVKLDVSRFNEAVLDRIEETIFQTRNAYWDYVKEIRLFQVSEEAYRAAKNFYDIIREQSESGLSEPPDVFGAEANVRERIQDLLETHLKAKLAMNRLKFTLSHLEDIAPSEELAFKEIEISFTDMMDQAMKHRRDYKQKLIEIQSRGLEVKVNRMKLLPKADFLGTFGSNALDQSLEDAQGEIFGAHHEKMFLGFELTHPLESREARAKTRRSDLDLKKSKLELSQLVQKIQFEIEDIYKELTIQKDIVAEAIKIEALQSEKLKAEVKQFRVGRSSSKTMIDYQEDLIGAEEGKIEALVAYEKLKDKMLRAENRLLEALGLTEAG